MKLHRLNRSSPDNTSITVSRNKGKSFLKVWHFHEELELVQIIESTGTRFVGDHIGKFQSGEIILLGKNLPHMWLNDDIYFQNDSCLRAEAIAVHFKESFMGKEFLTLSEMRPLVHLFNTASQGIIFSNVPSKTTKIFENLDTLDPDYKIIKTLEILVQLTKVKNYELLSSRVFLNKFHQTEDQRLNLIYEFVFQNFYDPISSRDMSKLTNMNPSAFSRYFKRVHRKPFTRFLNEIRIGYACKLLLENQESITSIGYACGFNNISNFNRQFKLIKGESPKSFSKRFNRNIRA
ncbi:AraC family transcriptional regulator [Flagellimonas lutimaris]|uniref:AraC family transcriptional regulator n=1 Tax=Flagellimonas lutimaris TaxID=475082 RepID=UPI003F5CF526